MTVHYSQRPDFDYQAACLGMADEDIRAELEIDWASGHGLPVYPQFRRAIHVAAEPFEFLPDEPLHIGWDWGQSPAACITQLGPFGEWRILPSFHPDQNEFESIYQFASHVADHLLREYAAPHDMELKDLQLVHIGDPAGRATVNQVGAKRHEAISAFRILAHGVELFIGEDENGKPIKEKKPGWGWHVIPGAVSVNERLEAVKSRLTSLLRDGVPALLVDPREEFIIGCFLGGYAYKSFSDGTFSRHPDKGHESHCMDALGYVATRLFARPTPKDEEDEDTPRYEFRSQASAARWR